MVDKEYIIKANLYDGLDCDDDIIFYQNDTGQSKIVAEFTGKKGDIVDISDCTVVCVIQKIDKEIVTACMDNSSVSNRAEYIFSQNALAAVGKGSITILVYGSDNERQTFGSIKFNVLKDVNLGNIESTSEYPLLTRIINETNNIKEEIERKLNNGEFDGKQGPQGLPGRDGVNGADGQDGKSLEFNWNGTELGIRKEGQQTFSYVNLKGQDGRDGKNGVDGTNGQDGADGYTPIKGTDYYTKEDKEELITEVLKRIPNGNEVAY